MVTATRRLAPRISSASERVTSSSEGERPSRSALVELHTIAVTPSSPSCVSLAMSVGAPITGVGSIFQSPVCSTSPSGVRMATALGSGIEWATEISSRSNGPTVKRDSSAITLTFGGCPTPYSANLARSIAAVNGVA